MPRKPRIVILGLIGIYLFLFIFSLHAHYTYVHAAHMDIFGLQNYKKKMTYTNVYATFCKIFIFAAIFYKFY